MYKVPDLRYKKTMKFLKESISKDEKILDLGTPNPFSEQMKKDGFDVVNTKGEDFDDDFTFVNDYDVTCFTSFEVFEHLLAPYNLLKEIKKGKLVSSVPLNVWFAKSFWNPKNEWDRHYHEFEPRQYEWLLEKAGWTIKKKELWTSPDKFRFGIRPILRYFVPSYYFVYAEKGLEKVK
jgi:hypothetical protein